MTTHVVMERIAEVSPRLKARMAGVFYLLAVLMAVAVAAFVRGKLLFVVGLIPIACFVVVTLLLYQLFKPVNGSLASLAAVFNLVGFSFEAVELQLWGANVALIFHGLYCLLIGYLVFEATFLPRILGVLMAMGGLAWLTDLSIPLTNHLAPYNLIIGFAGEGLMMLWLLVISVNAQRWHAYATGAGESPSPGLQARIAGVLYAVIFITAPSGAATATPSKMIINLACDTAVALILYYLLKPVSKRLSLLAAFFRLIFVAVMGVNSLNYFGVLDLYNSAHSAVAFNLGYGIAMVPFGIHCVLIGYLIFRSGFLSRILGFLMALAGSGYLIFLWPPLGSHLFVPYIAVPGVVGEGSLTLWLIFMGINAQRWTEQACAAAAHA